MNILGICESPDILKVMRLIVLFINIIKAVVPIILILTLVIRLLSAVTKGNEDALASIKKTAPSNIVAAVLIFLVPTLVGIVTKISFPNSEYVKCLNGISSNKINEAYDSKAKKLVEEVEKTLDKNDYDRAMNYLIKIKNEELKEELSKRLKETKENIEGKISNSFDNQSNDYSKVNYDNFKWTAYESTSGPANKYYSDVLPYGVWGPEDVNDLNGVSLPLMVWLHGSGELSYQEGMSIKNYLRTAFPEVISNWNKTGLKRIPAIIVAPQAYSQWASEIKTRDKNLESIKAIIESSKEKYNIDLNNVVLMGHSIGGNGVIHVSYEMQKKYSHDYFNKLVIMSGTTGVKYPSDDTESGLAYFSKKEIRGYSEDKRCQPFFEWINKPSDFRLINGVSHRDLPEKAMHLDENNDGVSDLVYWLFKKN